MSNRSATRDINRPPPMRRPSRAAQLRLDADAFLVTVLTMIATMIALYDLLLIGYG